MAKLNIMPLYTDAWSGDVSDLPNELYGAYTRLIVRWWREGAMPEENERKLARWAGVQTAGFEDLKEFLHQTDKGWIQRKLMKTYAQQWGKSEKARYNASAQKKTADTKRALDERLAGAYADRQLSMIHEPCSKVEEASASSPEEKNKNKKENQSVSVPRETPNLPLPDNEHITAFAIAFMKAFDAGKFQAWFFEAAKFIGQADGEKIRFETPTEYRRDQISNRFGAWLDEYFGKDGWSVAPPLEEAA